jgi:hypothetical protein
MISTIEDILEFLYDKNYSNTIAMNSNDYILLSSIARQIGSGKSLTDRQFDLLKFKLSTYKNEIESICNYSIDNAMDTLRNPLRSIDRSKYITTVTSKEIPEMSVPAYKEDWYWIKIRFPFNKATIQLVEKLSVTYKNHYFHHRSSHNHYFKLTEATLFNIIDVFKDRNFDISESLIEKYNEIKSVKETPESYIPGFYANEFKNFKQAGLDLIESELGNITDENILHLYDRRFRYGITHFNKISASGLVDKIVNRESTEMSIDPSSHDINKITESLINLERFPLLVLIDADCSYEQTTKVYHAFDGVIPAEKQCALFRVNNSNEYNVNNFIQDKKLNNWLDADTQIVYILKDKLPKLLTSGIWNPIATLALTSNHTSTSVSTYVKDTSDLIIYHDVDTGLIKRKIYGYM